MDLGIWTYIVSSVFEDAGVFLAPKITDIAILKDFFLRPSPFMQQLLIELSILLSFLMNFFRLLLVLLFIMSFLMKPIQRPFMALWARIIESDKPVFTLLFGGGAAAAKAIEAVIQAL